MDICLPWAIWSIWSGQSYKYHGLIQSVNWLDWAFWPSAYPSMGQNGMLQVHFDCWDMDCVATRISILKHWGLLPMANSWPQWGREDLTPLQKYSWCIFLPQKKRAVKYKKISHKLSTKWILKENSNSKHGHSPS